MNASRPATPDRRRVGHWLTSLIVGGLGGPILLHGAATPVRASRRVRPDCPPAGPERNRCLREARRQRRERRRERAQDKRQCRRRLDQGKRGCTRRSY